MKKREPLRIGTDEDYQAIEKAAGIETPNDAFRRQLSIHIENFIKRLETGYTEVRNAAFLEAVRRIRKTALLLHDDLTGPERYDDKSKEAWAYDVASIRVFGEIVVDPLSELIEASEIILDTTTPDKGGRAADANFHLLLKDLTTLYEEVTESEAGVTQHETYQGPFFLYVKEALERLAPLYPRGDDALGKALQRHLQQRQKRLGMDKT